MYQFLWGVVSVLLAEMIVLIFATEWLEKRVENEKDDS